LSFTAIFASVPTRSMGARMTHPRASVTIVLLFVLSVLPTFGAPRADDPAVLLALPPADGPVVVQASFVLRDVNDIDDSAETFQFGGILTLTWKDPRQAFDPAKAGVAEKLYQGAYQFNEIAPAWYPQVVLANQSGLFETTGVLLRSKPDGTQTLHQAIDAVAEGDFRLRRLPFDAQSLRAEFEILGMDDSAVRLEVAPGEGAAAPTGVHVPQWELQRTRMLPGDRLAPELGPNGRVSQAVLAIDVARVPLYVVRLIVFPLTIIVALSWAVFWMDRAAIADRISVSFVGILTAVAYQLVVGDIMPDVAYVTVLHGFLNISFLMMCASVVVNLVVGWYDDRGWPDVADRIDRRCRWLFPLAYVGFLLLGGFAVWHLP